MKVAIFNTFYFPKFIGGAEISVQLLAEGLVKAGHEVSVITFGRYNGTETIKGVQIIRIQQSNVFSSFEDEKRPAYLKILWHLIDSFNPSYYFTIKNILKYIKPDVVHTNNIQGFSPFLWLLIKYLKYPLVHTLRDYYLLCHRNNLYSENCNCIKLCSDCKVTHSIKKNFAGTPDCMVGISKFILEKHEEYIPRLTNNNTTVIYNAVDKPAVASTISNNGKIIFGYIGRISEDKGVEYLLREISHINKNLKSDFKILLAGKGEPEYIDYLKKYLKGIDYEFLGLVNPANFYSKIHVSIVPSLWYEPFGRIVIEALSYSVPVCLSKMGGLGELNNPDCTWAFDPDKNQLTEVLEHIINHKAEISLKKSKCIDHAEKFSAARYVREYTSVYKKVISGLTPVPKSEACEFNQGALE